MLSTDQVEQYRRDGYVFPIRAIHSREAAVCLGELARLEETHRSLSREEFQRTLLRYKPHLRLLWLDRLVRHPAIVEAVSDLIGPDILCWASAFFSKAPRDPGFVSWHQDSVTYNLEGGELVTAWIALNDVDVSNGAMRFLPSSHRQGPLTHRDTWEADNMLSRGEVVDRPVDETAAVDVVLSAGEMSLHHIDLLHSSPPNISDRPRTAYTIRYMSPSMRPRSGEASALLVAGQDRYRHFLLESPPRPGREAEALQVWDWALKLRAASVFKDAGGKSGGMS